MIERILLVLDGSKIAELAVPYAEGLAKAFSSCLTLLGLEKEAGSGQGVYLKRLSQEVSCRIGDVQLRTAEVTGDPVSGIINYAEQNQANLIVMGTHSHRGILLWPTGNIAIKVLEGTCIPVLSIKSTTPEPSELLARIVVPLDGSEAGEAALPYAAAIARHLKSELTLLRVVEPGTSMETFSGLLYVQLPPEEVQRLMVEARGYLCKVSRSLSGIKRIRVKVRQGRPPRDVIKFAEEAGADLIALSTHGASAPTGLFGSVFRKVLQAGKTHILAVRPPT